jgi:hypothetical protein
VYSGVADEVRDAVRDAVRDNSQFGMLGWQVVNNFEKCKGGFKGGGAGKREEFG